MIATVLRRVVVYGIQPKRMIMKKLYLLLLLSLALPLCAMDGDSSANAGDDKENAQIGNLDVVDGEGGVGSGSEQDRDADPVDKAWWRRASFARAWKAATQLFGGENSEAHEGLRELDREGASSKKLVSYLKSLGIPVAGVCVCTWASHKHIQRQRKLGKPNIFQRVWREVRGLVVRSEKKQA